MPEPITDATLRAHRAVAVADSASAAALTMGLLGGRDVLTVDSMQAKIKCSCAAWAADFCPSPWYGLCRGRPTGGPGRTARTQRAHALCLGWPGLYRARPGAAMVAEPAAKPCNTACAAGKPPPFLMRKSAPGVVEWVRSRIFFRHLPERPAHARPKPSRAATRPEPRAPHPRPPHRRHRRRHGRCGMRPPSCRRGTRSPFSKRATAPGGRTSTF